MTLDSKTKTFEYLPSTGDTTDRTKDIRSMLETDGVCHLGSGDFYVTDLVMPENTMLTGNGAATRLILANDIEKGFAVEIRTKCTIKDLYIRGTDTWITASETLGERHGIVFQSPDPTDDKVIPTYGTIENCHIMGFNGGGITCNGTGYSPSASLNVSNCWIENCGAGINISFWSEFHRFTNVSVTWCWYGCINNGGNNMFANCGFNCNQLAFLIDNSKDQSRNNAHGSAVGCTFNHSGNNKGTGIKILGTVNGYVFSSCQVFYSKIELENVKGVLFNGLNFGSHEGISVTGGTSAIFTNCLFSSAPILTLKDNEDTRFINCYTRKGEEVIF